MSDDRDQLATSHAARKIYRRFGVRPTVAQMIRIGHILSDQDSRTRYGARFVCKTPAKNRFGNDRTSPAYETWRVNLYPFFGVNADADCVVDTAGGRIVTVVTTSGLGRSDGARRSSGKPRSADGRDERKPRFVRLMLRKVVEDRRAFDDWADGPGAVL